MQNLLGGDAFHPRKKSFLHTHQVQGSMLPSGAKHCRIAALLPHRFAQAYMTQFPFFKLWPDAVQRELARVLLTEVRVCHETIIARATPLTKVFFLLRGTVSAAGQAGRQEREGQELREWHEGQLLGRVGGGQREGRGGGEAIDRKNRRQEGGVEWGKRGGKGGPWLRHR